MEKIFTTKFLINLLFAGVLQVILVVLFDAPGWAGMILFFTAMSYFTSLDNRRK